MVAELLIFLKTCHLRLLPHTNKSENNVRPHFKVVFTKISIHTEPEKQQQSCCGKSLLPHLLVRMTNTPTRDMTRALVRTAVPLTSTAMQTTTVSGSH